MLMPPPYRPAAAPTAGFGAEIFLNSEIFASRRGVPLKMGNFVQVLSNFAPQGIPLGHSAPSPVEPARKHYTTPTVLSSGEALKKTNFVGVLSNFALVIAPPFAPGGSLFFLPTAYCLLPTAPSPSTGSGQAPKESYTP